MTPPAPEELVRHAEALRRLARELVGGNGPWEDLVQGTYLVALQRPPRVLSRAWLAQVLRNRARDDHRRSLAARQEPAPRVAEAQTGGVEPPEVAERLELHAELVAAVGALREPYRAAVYLRYFEDATPTQIAARLGVPLKTVKTRLARGLAQLREDLDRRLGSDRRGGLLALLPLAYPHRATPVGIAAGTTTGIGIMLKKLAIVAAALLGLVGLNHLRTLDDPVEPDGGGEVEAATALGPAAQAQVAPEELEEVEASTARESVEQVVVAPRVATGVGALRVQVLSPDRQPLEGVYVGVRTTSEGISSGVAFEPSDAEGLLRLDGLQPGTYYVFCERAEGNFADVEADAESTIEFVVSAGVEVRGQVVDAAGRGVAGASIWQTTGQRRWMGGRVVATTDASGAFHLAEAAQGQSLGALAPGHAPSPLVDLDLVEQDELPLQVRLTLSEPGGSLGGVVLDETGQAVEGARVAVGLASRWGPFRLGKGRVESWTPRSVVTTADGRFHFDAVAQGARRVTVRAEGSPLLQTDVEVRGTGHTERELILPVGGWVEGRVLDGQGRAVAGAIVRVFDQQPTNLDEDYIDRGQFDYDGTFPYPLAETDAEGRYRVENVRPGEVQVFANPVSEDNEIQPFDRGVVQVTAGAGVQWDAVFTSGLAIEGTVTFKSGAPIDELFVIAQHEESGSYHSSNTDAEGRFSLIQLEDGLYTVFVQMWPRLDEHLFEPIQRMHVRPGGAPLALVASHDEPTPLQPGTVRGRVDDRAGRLLAAAGTMLANDRDNSWRSGELKEGTFSFSGIEPGRYQLFLLSGQETVFGTEVFELHEGQDLDLGTLTTEPPGSALVTLGRPEGTEGVEVSLGAHLLGVGWGSTPVGTATEHSFEDLCPGQYELHLRGEGVVDLDIPFEIHSGAVSRLGCTLEAAVARDLEIWVPEDAQLAKLRLLVEDEAGQVIEDRTLSRGRLAKRPIVHDVELPVGSLRVTVEATGGLSGALELEQRSLAPDQPALRIDVE